MRFRLLVALFRPLQERLHNTFLLCNTLHNGIVRQKRLPKQTGEPCQGRVAHFGPSVQPDLLRLVKTVEKGLLFEYVKEALQ